MGERNYTSAPLTALLVGGDLGYDGKWEKKIRKTLVFLLFGWERF